MWIIIHNLSSVYSGATCPPYFLQKDCIMKKDTTMACGIFAVLLALAVPEAYSAPKKAAGQAADYAIANNDFEMGIEAIKRGQEQKRPAYNEKNAVSLYLDKGLLEHYAGNYAASSDDLQRAERLIEDAFTKSVSQAAASYIANDNAKEYPGEDFEDIYINVFNALNYYNRGDFEGALVEIRKLTWTNGKLDMLERKYERARTRTGEYMREQLSKIGIAANPQLPQGNAVNFSDSALSHYLGALFYQGSGSADSARIEFEKLRSAHAANPKVYYHPFPASAMDARTVPPGKARLNVIGFAGLSPVKEEGVFPGSFPFFQNAALTTPAFKLPKFVKRPDRIDRIEAAIEGAGAFNLELIEDMGAVAEETYNARFGSLFFKTYIRTLLKYAAVEISAIAAGQTKGGSLAQSAVVLAGKKAADATEKADVRMARYFPGKAYIGGINLDPGSYAVAIRYYQGGNVIAEEERRVDVKAGALNLLETVNLGGGGTYRPSGGGGAGAAQAPAAQAPANAASSSSPRSSPASAGTPAPAAASASRRESSSSSDDDDEGGGENSARLHTIGVSIGSAFADPWVIATIHGTFSPARNLFMEIGLDIGTVSIYGDVSGYSSLYPYFHIGGFIPFQKKGGWYIGGGGGYMTGWYTFNNGKAPVPLGVFAADAVTGFNIGNVFDISYTLRTDFRSVGHKVMAGYTYRF